jgi:hypothetical protein
MLSRFLPSSARMLQPQRLTARAPSASSAQPESLSSLPAQLLENLLYRSEGFVEDLGPGYASRLDPQFNPAALRL